MTAALDPLTLDEIQTHALIECQRVWPGEDLSRRGNALAEECGEVNRAINKLSPSHAGYRTDTDWRANLEHEVGQAMFVLLTIAEAEGFSARDAVLFALAEVAAKDSFEERQEAGR